MDDNYMKKQYTGIYEIEIYKENVIIWWKVPAYEHTFKIVNPSKKQLIDLLHSFILTPAAPQDGIFMGRYFFNKIMGVR